MFTSIIIILLSVAMFAYWFRYSCVLILETSWSEDQAKAVAAQNGLQFGSVENSLAQASSVQALDRVRDLLDQDMERVIGLLERVPSVQVAGRSLECQMLMLDYRLLKAWYSVTRSFAAPKAQQALREMSQVVGYIAGECGDHTATAHT